MTNLLIKLFIKSPRDVSSPAVRRAYGTLVSTVGIILNQTNKVSFVQYPRDREFV